jgi:hypothetical protein
LSTIKVDFCFDVFMSIFIYLCSHADLVASMGSQQFASFLDEATRRFQAIPRLDERLVPIPNPDQWLFNEHYFRPTAERFVSEAAHLPPPSREGIMGSPEYLYHAHMMRAPVGFGEAYRDATDAKSPFDAHGEFARRADTRVPETAPGAGPKAVTKVGPNQRVSIRKGEEVQSMKYKKAQLLLSEGWQLVSE